MLEFERQELRGGLILCDCGGIIIDDGAEIIDKSLSLIQVVVISLVFI